MLTVRILSFCKMKFVRSHWSLLLIVLLVIKIREFIPESPNIMGSKLRLKRISLTSLSCLRQRRPKLVRMRRSLTSWGTRMRPKTRRGYKMTSRRSWRKISLLYIFTRQGCSKEVILLRNQRVVNLRTIFF